MHVELEIEFLSPQMKAASACHLIGTPIVSNSNARNMTTLVRRVFEAVFLVGGCFCSSSSPYCTSPPHTCSKLSLNFAAIGPNRCHKKTI